MKTRLTDPGRLLGALLCVVASSALAIPADAGYRLVDKNGQETLVSKGRVKTVAKKAEDPAFVYDLGRGRLWFANPRTKSYWEGTPDEFCTGMRAMTEAAMADAEARMKEQMAKMPPEQRAQMEKMMRERGIGAGASVKPVQVSIERTSETATIAGQTARKFRVTSDGKPFEDVWLASDSGLSREVDLSKAPSTYGRLVGCQPSAAGRGAQTPRENPEYGKLYAQGWPFRTVLYGPDGVTHVIAEIVTLEPRDIADAEFAPPAGFAKVPLKDLMGQPKR